MKNLFENVMKEVNVVEDVMSVFGMLLILFSIFILHAVLSKANLQTRIKRDINLIFTGMIIISMMALSYIVFK